MLWQNLNSPDVLWKKLNRVQNCVIVWIVKFFRATQGWERQIEKKLWIFFDRASSTLSMLWPNLNSPDACMSWGKSWTGSNCVIVWSQILRTTHRQGEGVGGRFVNLFDRSKPYLGFGQTWTGRLYANRLVFVNFKCISIVQVVRCNLHRVLGPI